MKMKTKRKKTATQYEIAQKVIESLGNENIIFHKENFMLWNSEKGIWEAKNNPREIKLLILSFKENATTNIIDSILKIIALLTENEDIKFNSSKGINCLNGEIHFTDIGIKLLPHNRESYSTTQIPVKYNPNAKAKRFIQFTREIFEFDKDRECKQKLILEFMGYSLVKTTKREKMLILVGKGANGKSTVFNIIQGLCGNENVAAVQPSEFNNKFQRAFLENKHVNLISELEVGKKINEGKLKAIISGDKSTVEHKYKSPHNMTPFVTCWIGTNHLPPLKDFSDGFFRRVEILEFNRRFDKAQCDLNLTPKLLEELEGILALVIDAYFNVIKRDKFTIPTSSTLAVQNWRDDMDQVKLFFDEKLTFDHDSIIESKELYSLYLVWSRENRIKIPIGHNNFTTRICYLGAKKYRTASKRMIKGVRLKYSTEEAKEKREFEKAKLELFFEDKLQNVFL